eukprot:COSAG02_NODE_202_length_29305_cov_20.432377_14_plen_128_part_00
MTLCQMPVLVVASAWPGFHVYCMCLQVTGNPVNDTVPASQCGCLSGFEFGSERRGREESKGYTCISVAGLTIHTTGKALVLDTPDAVAGMTLRYLFADWPTPTVYSGKSFLGPNGHLPTPPFVMTIE